MTQHWKIGGVQLELREDDSFFIYQPDANRLFAKSMILDVASHILAAYGYGDLLAGEWSWDAVRDQVAGKTGLRTGDQVQVTVPSGVIGTSEGPKATLSQMTAAAAADGSDEVATEFVDTRPELDPDTHKAMIEALDATDTDKVIGPTSTPDPKPPVVKRRPGRPRKAQP